MCYFCTLSPEIECGFLLLHGFKSNVRHNRPDLTSTQEHESHTVTKTGSQYNIKQRNNFLGKENDGLTKHFCYEKELNGIARWSL